MLVVFTTLTKESPVRTLCCSALSVLISGSQECGESTEQYGCHAGSSVSQTCFPTATEVEKRIRLIEGLLRYSELADITNAVVGFDNNFVNSSISELFVPFVAKIFLDS